jgi:hypothetical protein
MAERIGRHAILFHARALGELSPIGERLVHDHFEVFVGDQRDALGIGTLVGASSWFVYDVDPAPHRGTGRRPDRYDGEEKTARPNRAYVKSIQRTFRSVISRQTANTPLVCNVDGRLDYKVAIRDDILARRIELAIFPNPRRGPKGSPRSAEAIERDAAMFPVDQLHQLLRHSCSDHKRETISFGRRLESVLGRAHLMAVWKNFIKKRSERSRDKSTPAICLGITDRRWEFERLFALRLFPGRENVSELGLKLYRKDWTPHLPRLNRKHAT